MGKIELFCEYYSFWGEERECNGENILWYDIELPTTVHYNLVTIALCDRHAEADTTETHDGSCPCHDDNECPCHGE